MKDFITFLIILFSFLSLKSQVSFSPKLDIFQDSINKSGVSIGVADMNGDGLDDIIRFDKSWNLNIEYQNPDTNGAFGNLYIGKVGTQYQWAICIADVDHNGFNDIVVGGAYDFLKLFKANTDGTSYARTNVVGSNNLFSQATNFVDINRDGWADIFSCHDEAENFKYENDGMGNFLLNDSLINTRTNPISDNSGDYGSVWTDYDSDGDIDLYISKCRAGVNDPSDPRRINMLFQNDGNNNFTEVADSAGLAFGGQSWTSDFGDIDNDGDLDVFVSNHDSPSKLMENNGDGTFTDIIASSGLDSLLDFYSIQVLWRDFDNDGWVDLFLTGSEDRLLFNNGDRTFTPATDFTPGNDIHSIAIGDLNHDGFLDIYAGYGNMFADTLFLNNTNDHHYFAITLKGTQSNINAIGTRIELYSALGQQVREVRSGEGYGIMNTFTQHFGLGNETQIDSVIIRWPGNTNENPVVDKIILPAIDQFMVVEEGMTTTHISSLADENVNIYPNPSRDHIVIEIASPFQKSVYVEMYDLTGRQIFQTSSNLVNGDSPFSLNISSLPSGIYLLHLMDEEGFPIYQTKIQKD